MIKLAAYREKKDDGWFYIEWDDSAVQSMHRRASTSSPWRKEKGAFLATLYETQWRTVINAGMRST
jgi:hypothetical protein